VRETVIASSCSFTPEELNVGKTASSFHVDNRRYESSQRSCHAQAPLEMSKAQTRLALYYYA